MIEAFKIPVLTCDGYEADDIIGTLVRRAEKQGFDCYMVTPDKDFGQLVTEHTFLYKPSRMGEGVEIMGVPEIQKRWSIERPEQVVDVMALMGDSVDNVPGVPGIGEKTAIKLIKQFGSVDNLLAHTAELSGRVKATLETNREAALVSKRLVTLICDAPCPIEMESLKVQPPDEEKLKGLLVEFEFNSIGRRLFGEEFKAGRGGAKSEARSPKSEVRGQEQLVLVGETQEVGGGEKKKIAAPLKTISEVRHEYKALASEAERKELVQSLAKQKVFSLRTLATGPDPKQARLLGLAFAYEPGTAFYVPLPEDADKSKRVLEEFKPVLASEQIEKIGHDLKFDLGLLKWPGFSVGGKLFDTMIAHSLIEPDMRHSLDYLAEAYLGYAPIQRNALDDAPRSEAPSASASTLDTRHSTLSCEAADLILQLRGALEPLLKEKAQQRVFYDIEAPLVPVLADMEYEGIKVDAAALADFGAQLSKEIDELEKKICLLAGTTFNVNSPRQLGQILFDVLKICDEPKKTRTGQYATDEQTLATLATDHEIVQRLLEHRAASKLKSTYADALPAAIWPRTSRVHTTFNQVMTSTGRLNSQDPNLQNIPIRTERGQEIRKAFVPRNDEFLLLSADYSQIELRIIAALSREAGLLEAFRTGVDVHTATAAKVYGLPLDLVTPEMRRKAKMVNYGIAYGISAFGLAQRLGIPRKEAAVIIEQYFKQFSGIRRYMDETIAFARKQGYVETVTGRRRYIRDITSLNNTVRGGAERNAINAPIQGTAADMIKLAMINIHRELMRRNLRTRMLLQVHDELVFDLYPPEENQIRPLIENKMKTAIELDVPIVVEMGIGENWLEAH